MKAVKYLILLTMTNICDTPLSAKTFYVPNLGVSIELPNTWIHDKTDLEGLTLIPPKGENTENQSRKIKIHLSVHQSADLHESLKKDADHLAEILHNGRVDGQKYFSGSYSVNTRTGMQGIKGEYGFIQNKVLTHIISKYLFRNSEEKIVCVCASVWGDMATDGKFQHLILDGLKLTDAQQDSRQPTSRHIYRCKLMNLAKTDAVWRFYMAISFENGNTKQTYLTIPDDTPYEADINEIFRNQDKEDFYFEIITVIPVSFTVSVLLGVPFEMIKLQKPQNPPPPFNRIEKNQLVSLKKIPQHEFLWIESNRIQKNPLHSPDLRN